MMNLRILILFMSCIGLTSSAYAQHENRLEEVTVSARPDGFQNVEHIAQAVSVLSGDELKEKLGNNLGETLSAELGVSASDFGRGAGRPIIRGLSGSRVAVMQDGIASLDVSSISVDHPTTIEPGQAEQIEILRGPATLLFGSGAFGGLVNVRTRRIPDEFDLPFSAELDFRFDTNANAKTTSVRLNGGDGVLAVHFDGLVRNSDNYSSGTGMIENSFVENEDLNIGFSIGSNENFFGVSLGRYASEFGIPINPDEPEEMVSIDQSQDRFDIAARLTQPFSGVRSAKFRLAYVDYIHTEFENPGEPGTEFFNNEWESRLELHHSPLGLWNGAFGLHYRHRQFDSVGEESFVPRTRLESLGIFLLEDTDIDRWHIEFGARLEFQKVRNLLSTEKDIQHSIYSLSFGMIYDFTQDVNLGMSLTRAQRAPSIEELLADGPHLASATYEEGDRTLEDEISNNMDISLRRSAGNLNWRANLYANYIENFIYQNEQDENGDGQADRVDEDRVVGGELLLINFEQKNALFYGLEMEAQYEIFSNKKGRLVGRIWGDWVNARLSNSENLPRIPPARTGFNLEYNHKGWHADLDFTHNFRQKKQATLESETASFQTLNIGMGYSAGIDKYTVDIFLRANNLLDELARRHSSFLKQRAPLPGRNVLLGLSAGF